MTPRITAIGSGKGGTGKTLVTVSLAHALAHAGVPANRISAQGYGETHLRFATGDHKKEPRNRRVEIVITPVPG